MSHWRNILFTFLLFLICIFQNINFSQREHIKAGITGVIHPDAFYYYQYLPEVLLNGNARHMPGNLTLETGNSLNKYTCGTAILQAPFFLVAHGYAKITETTADGYSHPYAYAILLAGITYSFLGLLMIFLLIRKWFSFEVAALSVLIIYLGTNLLHYIFAEPGMSHAYSFFCIAGILFFTERFFSRDKSTSTFLVLSFLLSLAILIRPTNIVLLFWLLLYDVSSLQQVKERFLFWIWNWKYLLLFILVLLFVMLPQLLYWHAVTGNWIVFSYGYNKEGFSNWKTPHLFSILFGVRSGWITYSPIMFFFLIGLPIMIYRKAKNGIAIAVIFVIIAYLCASWWDPTFSCSCGYRSLIEFYPIFILPIAFLIFQWLKINKTGNRIAVYLVLIVFVYVGLRLCLDYTAWPFCMEDFSWDQYLNELRSISPIH